MARVSAVVAPLAVLAMVLVAMLCAVSVPTATAMESRFRKKFDVDKLSESWGEDDEEDEDWHEDNFEWREKEEEKRKAQVQFDPSDPSTFQNFQASQAATGMQMAFAKLHSINNKKEAEDLAGKWQALLKTGSIDVMVYAIEDDSILLTNDNGKMHEVQTFVLDQPEVEKFTWNSQDTFPKPKVDETEAATSTKKKGKKKGKKKSKKKGKKKGKQPKGKKAKRAGKKKAKKGGKKGKHGKKM